MSQERYKVTRRVSAYSAFVNLLLALSKMIIGYLGYSQALIADGIHSLSDVISDGLVVFAAKASIQAPDAKHPYGHHRIETITVIIIALLLLAIGASILYPAITHLLHRTTPDQPNILALVTAILSVFANEGLFRYCLRQGQRIQSSLLISNAWHNRSDALVSLIVIASIIGGYLGWPFLDSVGAAIISLVIIYVSMKMLWQSGNELIDAATDPKTINTIEQCIQNTPGVIAVHNLRTRHHGSRIFIDVHVQVSSLISVSEGHYIADQAERAIQPVVPAVKDVAIHIDPEDDSVAPNVLHHANRAKIEKQLEQAWKTLNDNTSLHQLYLHYLEGRLTADIVLSISNNTPQDLPALQTTYQQKAIKETALDDCQIYFWLSDTAS